MRDAYAAPELPGVGELPAVVQLREAVVEVTSHDESLRARADCWDLLQVEVPEGVGERLGNRRLTGDLGRLCSDLLTARQDRRLALAIGDLPVERRTHAPWEQAAERQIAALVVHGQAGGAHVTVTGGAEVQVALDPGTDLDAAGELVTLALRQALSEHRRATRRCWVEACTGRTS